NVVGSSDGLESGECNCPPNESPLVIDLKNDLAQASFPLLAPTLGPWFDIDHSGNRTKVSWPANDNAFLALPDDSGNVKSINQLCGNRTEGPAWAPGEASGGFAALAKYDLNGDGVIDRGDAIFAKLRIWRDRNHNGAVDDGELTTLENEGIVSFNLGAIDM